MTITLPAGQRNAIYAEIRADLLGIDDLRLAIEGEDFETADHLARRFAGELRLILCGLEWRAQAAGPVEITMPVEEARSILAELRDRAIDVYEAGRPEQETFREPWERVALVRDACNQALGNLPEQ